MAINKNTKPFLIVISAPSGGGKSTILNSVIKEFSNIKYSISSTTRKPRGEEKNGIDYFFLSKEEFEKKISAGNFLEYANVFGNYYGTSNDFIYECFSHNKCVIMDIDVQGCLQLENSNIPMIKIFVLPPDIDTLESRLRNRATDTNEVIIKRLNTAKEELQLVNHYDYLVVNDNLENAVNKVKSIIISEMNKTFRYENIIKSFYNID